MSVNITSNSADYETDSIGLYVQPDKVYFENRKDGIMFLVDANTTQFRRSDDTGYFGVAWSLGRPSDYMFATVEEALQVVDKIKAVMDHA